MDELVFLKLGGSLITDKTRQYALRAERVSALALEIRSALAEAPNVRLVLGHGSGSFGHVAYVDHLNPAVYPASTEARPRSDTAYWNGVAEVWYRASQLNRYVVDALHTAGIPTLALAPSAAAISRNGTIESWDLRPLRAALSSGVLPVIFGDIVFDPILGAKVLSTEVLMWHLAQELRPGRILLAGIEEAVWADFPKRVTPIGRISPASFRSVAASLGPSHGQDVTGGMRSKVEEMLDLVRKAPGLTVQIFSGEIPGNLGRALRGDSFGTIIADD